MRSIGLDIGHWRIKIAALSGNSRNAHLESWGSIETPDQSVKKNRVANPQALSKALRTVANQSGISPTQVVLGINSPEIVIKQLRLPKMSKKNLKEALKYELPELVNFSFKSTKELAYSYDVVNTEGDEQDVVVAVCRKDLVRPYISVAKDAGVTLVAIEMQSFALPELTPQASQVCFVNVGHMQTAIYVEVAGQFKVHRILPVGGRGVTEAIVQDLNVHVQKAQEIKHSPDIEDIILEEDDQAPSLQAVLERLLDGVRQTMDFLRARERVSEVSEIIEEVVLCGGGAALAGLGQYIQNGIEVPVRILDPFQTFPAATETDAPSDGHSLATAVSLAARGLRYYAG